MSEEEDMWDVFGDDDGEAPTTTPDLAKPAFEILLTMQGHALCAVAHLLAKARASLQPIVAPTLDAAAKDITGVWAKWADDIRVLVPDLMPAPRGGVDNVQAVTARACAVAEAAWTKAGAWMVLAPGPVAAAVQVAQQQSDDGGKLWEHPHHRHILMVAAALGAFGKICAACDRPRQRGRQYHFIIACYVLL